VRTCEYIGIPSLFQGRVDGVGKSADGDVTFEKELSLTDIVNRIKVPNANTGVPNPNTGIAGPKTNDWFVKKQKEAADAQKKLKDAESWRSNTPIASWSAAAPSGNMNVIKVFGYNKELGAVWINEGENSRAVDSMIVSDAALSAKSPEWVAAKASLGKSSALPILLGAAYLLLS
jgi:hypothetical protein